jgi:4-hydroxythreonine-4-phosphate dehydrogenase
VTVRRIVITSGEPAGIGPDLCIDIAARDQAFELVIAADATVLADRAAALGRRLHWERYDPAAPPAPHRAGHPRLLDRKVRAPVQPGRLDPANAGYVLSLLDDAADGCRRGEFDAMVTAPVHKGVIADAGIPFTGHTEYLARRLGCPLPVMLLVADELRVALATTHLPLRAVPDALTRGLLGGILDVLHQGLRTRFRIPAPRILVCGLNPHAGEGGHLGNEEIEVIAPAIEAARSRGIDARGPLPADTAFTPASLAGGDAVLAMFHDQGLPVLKHAGFGRGVNVTLGLPVVRTSVDHGTALDLAATGRADPGSLVAALELAVRIAG